MSNEHNPIALRISKLQQAWREAVSDFPEKPVFRWVIESEAARIFDGFCKLESSPHGSLPEVFVVMFTPFVSPDSFAKELIGNWIDAFDREKEEISGFKWNSEPFRGQLHDADAPDEILLRLLKSFREALGGRELVLGLIPITLSTSKEFGDWLEGLVKLGIPKGVRFMILDYDEEKYFEKLAEENPSWLQSLLVNLDYQGAIDKLARQGNPNAPDVQFRVCMLEMSKAVKSGNLNRLENLGQQLLEIGQRSGERSMFATAHVVYAGMLFHFKRDEEINDLLKKGLRVSQKGLGVGDASLQPIYIQCLGYMAANHQLQGRYQAAVDGFLSQAEACISSSLSLQAIPALHQALEIARRKVQNKEKAILYRSFEVGQSLSDEEMPYSDYAYIAKDICDLSLRSKEFIPLAEAIEEKMIPVFGDEWKTMVEKRRKEYSASNSRTLQPM